MVEDALLQLVDLHLSFFDLALRLLESLFQLVASNAGLVGLSEFLFQVVGDFLEFLVLFLEAVLQLLEGLPLHLLLVFQGVLELGLQLFDTALFVVGLCLVEVVLLLEGPDFLLEGVDLDGGLLDSGLKIGQPGLMLVIHIFILLLFLVGEVKLSLQAEKFPVVVIYNLFHLILLLQQGRHFLL